MHLRKIHTTFNLLSSGGEQTFPLPNRHVRACRAEPKNVQAPFYRGKGKRMRVHVRLKLDVLLCICSQETMCYVCLYKVKY
jgi:hypothetical protein